MPGRRVQHHGHMQDTHAHAHAMCVTEKPSAPCRQRAPVVTMSDPVPEPPFEWNEASDKVLNDLIALHGPYAKQAVFEAELLKTFSRVL